jgi:hypothetical protein
MPDPNFGAAAIEDGLEERVLHSYSAQLYLRKHLNKLHNMFYRPKDGKEPRLVPSNLTIVSKFGVDSEHFYSRNPHHFPTLKASLQNLEEIKEISITKDFKWTEDDEPATDILGARLRAKYYGAKVITYRHFLLKILEQSHNQRAPAAGSANMGFADRFKHIVNNLPQFNANAGNISELDDRAFEYASDFIKALFKSTTAFHNLGDPATTRLIVTNIWGTAHAYVSCVFLLFSIC